jgi:hypothetical protein
MKNTTGITKDNVWTTLTEELALIQNSGITKRRKAKRAFANMADRFLRLFALEQGEANLPTTHQVQEFLIYSILSLNGVKEEIEVNQRLQDISQSILTYFRDYRDKITIPLPGLPGGPPLAA